MMAADRPFSRARAKKVLPTPSLSGRPKEMLDTPRTWGGFSNYGKFDIANDIYNAVERKKKEKSNE